MDVNMDNCCGCGGPSGNERIRQLYTQVGISPVPGYVNANHFYAHAEVTTVLIAGYTPNGYSSRKDWQWDHVSMILSQLDTPLVDGGTAYDIFSYGSFLKTEENVVSDTTLIVSYYHAFDPGGPWTLTAQDTCVLSQGPEDPQAVLLNVTAWADGFAFEQVAWDTGSVFQAYSLSGHDQVLYANGQVFAPVVEWTPRTCPWLAPEQNPGLGGPTELGGWNIYAATGFSTHAPRFYDDQIDIPLQATHSASGYVYYGRSRLDNTAVVCMLEAGISSLPTQVSRYATYGNYWPNDPNAWDTTPWEESMRACTPHIVSGSQIVNAPTPNGYRLVHNDGLSLFAGYGPPYSAPTWLARYPDCLC